MERFTGQPLRVRPHVAVLFYDAIGDFVVATPLLRGLREKYPGCAIDYFSGERSRELEQASPLIDSRFSVFGRTNALRALPGYLRRRQLTAGPYDLAINLDDHAALALVTAQLGARYVLGRCYDGELRSLLPNAEGRVEQLYDEDWASPDLPARFADVLSSQYIGEIFCRLARVETDFTRTEVPQQPPPFPTPPLLIATGGKRSAKLWPAKHWLALLAHCRSMGLEAGLLGDAPQRQTRQYHAGQTDELILSHGLAVDLRGRLTLPQVCGALRRARVCVTIDNGIMHLAGAVGVPTLALFGASPWRLWAPRSPNLHVVLGSEPCPLCEENRFRNEGCLRERQVCMESLDPARVAALVGELAREPL